MAEVRRVQVGQQQGDGTVMDREGHAMDADGQRAGLVVTIQVGAGDEQLPDQGARLGFVGQMLAQ